MPDHDPRNPGWTLKPAPPGAGTVAASLYPDDLRAVERRIIGRDPRVGVALSGGGIRSATFSLGFFQGLARHSLLRHVDVLSTVSGGGYFGAFLGHLIRRTPADAPAPEGPGAPEELPRARSMADSVLSDPRAPAVRFLRDNGRYLAPQGTGDLLAAAAVALRNWVSIQVVLILPILAVAALALLGGLRLESLIGGLTDARQAWPLSWLSPFFLLAALSLTFVAIPPGWAYWLVPDGGRGSPVVRAVARWLAPVAIAGVTAWSLPGFPFEGWQPRDWLTAAVGTVAVLTMARYLIGRAWLAAKGSGVQPQVQRGSLSRGLKRALVFTAILAAWGIVDTIALGIVEVRNVGIAGAYALIVAAAGAVRGPLLRLAAALGANDRPPALKALTLKVGAALILFGVVGGVASLPHFLVAGDVPPLDALPRNLDGGLASAQTKLLLLAAGAAVLALATGRIWTFVNRSSLHALYEARLRRAYLGASNRARTGEGEDRPALTEARAGDGMTWPEYAAWGRDGPGQPPNLPPLHLINVTINETVDGRSQVQQRDRKGVGMAVGPAGVSVGRTHHAVWEPPEGPWRLRDALSGIGRRLKTVVTLGRSGPAREDGSGSFRVFPARGRPELLDVGQWVAVSGGAVSTGLGARTDLALSLLCGFFNIRLGYWWDSGVDPTERSGATEPSRLARALTAVRAVIPVQGALLDEWLARFPGTSRRDWYLSDGGHFENLGGYELLRRRLPFILVCDNEQDQDYTFAGLANLVRKARIDLGAEIEFLPDAEARKLFSKESKVPIGGLDSLRRGRHSFQEVPTAGAETRPLVTEATRDGLSLAHASLAKVTYRDHGPDGAEIRTTGLLVYVKPSLDGDEPADVTEYHRHHRDFPHESTGDQFFDEAQWESYRSLGQHIAERLFQEPGGLTSRLEAASAGRAEDAWSA